jgi:hypothetical protein
MSVSSTAEKFELAAIPVATALAAALVPAAGLRLDLGVVVAGGALLILGQGFFRDLWLLREARRQKAAAPAREARCMCVESALGLTGVVAGIGLVGFGLTRPVAVSAAGLAAGVAAAMIAGFLLKDFVFEWSPWKIYREKNHAQVIFRWRK